MATILKDEQVRRIANNVKPDPKRRVLLPKALIREGVTYHIYINSFDQVILDPQVTIPASEAWLFNNSDALALVRQGLSDVAQGRVSKVDLDTL